MQFNEPFLCSDQKSGMQTTVMNKKLELTLRACHQNTDDALKAGVVSLFHLGLLQHGQAFMIKAMTRFPNSFAACGLSTLWERKCIGLDLLSAAEISAMSSAVITCNLQFDRSLCDMASCSFLLFPLNVNFPSSTFTPRLCMESRLIS